MFSVTQRATRELEEMLDQLNVQPDKGLRLIQASEGTLGVAVDSRQEEDHVIQSGAREILFIEKELSVILATTELDSEMTEEGPAFFLRPKGPPPAKANGTVS